MAFVQCDGLVLRGKVDEKRSQLSDRLPQSTVDLSYPEYETQDDVTPEMDELSSLEDMSEDSDPDDRVIIGVRSVQDLSVGEVVEVYWRGEKTWYEGEVTEVDLDDSTYQVYYKEDSSKY